MKIISGGQTGVDRAALDAAVSLGIACGGWCPAGRLDENGIIPAHYSLQELPVGGYVERTARNVSETDGTAIFHPGSLQGGTKATADFCTEKRKPCLLVDASRIAPTEGAEQLKEFVRANRIEVLNVAGPRAGQWPQGYEFTVRLLREFLTANAGVAEPPKLSFVVPAHNEEHELPETLRAIRRAADSANESYELIVVDDASTDSTATIAQQFGARIVPVDRRQIAAVRNAGAWEARGEILFFVDADTRINPGHVAAGLEALAAGWTGGSARVMMDRKAPFWGEVCLRVVSTLYFATGLGAGAFLFTRRELFERVGGFDEQYFAGEEVYLSLALKKLGRFKILREPIVTSGRKLRMHSAGFVVAQMFSLFLSGQGALRTREKLSLWYDGKREKRVT